MDAESQYHRNVHRRNGEEHAVLIGGDRRDGSFFSDARAQIGGEPRHGSHPGVDSQRHRNGENSAQILNDLCFSVLCINVRIQRFYYEVIEKAPDRTQPNGKHRLPQPIGAGQIVGSVEKAGVGLLKRNAAQQPVPGSHQNCSDRTEMYHRISFFGFSVFIFFASDCSS